MKSLELKVLASIGFLVLSFNISHAQALSIQELVDNFAKATDIQRTQIENDVAGKELIVKGVVENASEYDFFDETNDIKGKYYRITTVAQVTSKNNPYQIILITKDINKVSDVNKGEVIERAGKIMNINDEKLQFSVWLFEGELSDKDKDLIK